MSVYRAVRRLAIWRANGLARGAYKGVWNGLSNTESRAKIHITGSDEEVAFTRTAARTLETLRSTVGIGPDDTILEIGCGIGRVGEVLAPLCKRWIGTDVSANMLRFGAKRLAPLSNVEFLETSGYDLTSVPDGSIDLVYCTVVFMHLDEWDRYNYVLEAHRVLRPHGRIYIDNFSLCTPEGWELFEAHRAIAPCERPPHISKSSTPQELETYLSRAGFQNVQQRS